MNRLVCQPMLAILFIAGVRWPAEQALSHQETLSQRTRWADHEVGLCLPHTQKKHVYTHTEKAMSV